MRIPAIALLSVLLFAVACSDSNTQAADTESVPADATEAEVATEPEPEFATEPESATEPEPAPEDTPSDEDESEGGTSGGSSISLGTVGGAGSQLELSERLSESELEEWVSDTLTGLEAETRAAETDTEAGDADVESDATSSDVETVVTLPDTVLFDFDDDALKDDAAQVLTELGEVLDYFTDAPVKVQGHTDSVGDPSYNQELSERRAQSVTDFLVELGIGDGRIAAEGFGEDQPVAPNEHDDGSDNPEGREQNRRVEIIISGVDPAELDG